MSDRKWVRSDDWVGTEVDGTYVMVNVETGKYVSLNPTALAIWEALETGGDERAIGEHVRGRFDVAPEECDAAVAQALETMREMSLVSPA